ncbi:MAG TPA: cell wall-binding repeat-containing protein, partial [Acidothermaceae bacterium]|nr:cell wall-binding repeat-containing protein [Acidothermaceae bacterium]
DPHDGYVVYYGGQLGVVGGTSAAAPLWASLLALVDSSCPGNRLGLINPALYALDSQNSAAFNDIATGNNDASGVNGGLYPSQAGYDMATGLGTPVGAAIGAGLCASPAAAGSGTLTVDQTEVPASSATTLTFTYTLPPGKSMADGELDINVPTGWSAPSTTNSDPGYTTSSLGQVRVSGTKIAVKGLTAIAGDTFTVTYGNTSSGGGGATAPSTARASTFTSSVSAVYGAAPKIITTSPTVTVWTPATPGQGAITVSPTSALTGTATTLTFTYAPPTNTKLVGGTITVDVPATWTPPQTSSSVAAAYVTVNTGTLTVTGSEISVSGVNLGLGQVLTITYGAGGHGGVAPAPQSSTFPSTQGGTAVSPTPVVSVLDVAPDGSGTLSVSPSTVAPSANATFTFTYKASTAGFVSNGAIEIVVPADWTAPSTTPGAAGEIAASAGSPAVNGQAIDVTSINLSPGASFTVTYGTKANGGTGAAVPSTTGSAVFHAKEQSSSGGSPVDLSDLTVTVANASSGGGGGGGGGFGHPDLTRVAGADRIATSVAASQAAFAQANSARVAVLARADSFADALSGTPLAAKEGGPLLLTNTTALPAATFAELDRVLPRGDTIYLLGGTSAISTGVQTQLAGLGYSVARLAGPDRYATAVAVAAALGNPTTVFEADGTNFPDALSAGSAAAQQGAAVLLTSGGAQSAATAGYLSAHPSVRYAVGGPAAKADPGATPLVGADRFATSVLVAARFFTAPLSVGLASGMNFPDALSGGAVTANHGGPILLVPSTGTVPAGTTSYLTKTAALSASSAWLFGGTVSVNDSVFSQSAAALKAS